MQLLFEFFIYMSLRYMSFNEFSSLGAINAPAPGIVTTIVVNWTGIKFINILVICKDIWQKLEFWKFHLN